MENIEKNTREENRRIVQDGLDRRAEARAHDEQEARMEAFERTMINGCNESAARHKAMEGHSSPYAVMEDPKATAKREKEEAWRLVKVSVHILTYYATFLLVLRFAEDFGAPTVATVHLGALAAVMAIAGMITVNRPAFRKWRKRRVAR